MASTLHQAFLEQSVRISKLPGSTTLVLWWRGVLDAKEAGGKVVYISALYQFYVGYIGIARVSSAFVELRARTDELCRLYSISILIDTDGSELFLLVALVDFANCLLIV
jgi:hypothetical protein